MTRSQIEEAGITVKNENLFSMMKSNVEREHGVQK